MEFESDIYNKIKSGDFITIALNHKSRLECDYYFFSNQKRYDEFKNALDISKIIISNNIKTDKNHLYVLDYAKLVYIDNEFFTNATAIFINFLVQNDIKSVELAGFDGYKIGKNNYIDKCEDIQSRNDILQKYNDDILKALKKLKSTIDIKSITPSIFKDNIEAKE